MLFSPQWPKKYDAPELWYRAACSSVVSQTDSSYLPKLFGRLQEFSDAKRIFGEILENLEKAGDVKIDEATLVESLSKDARWRTLVSEALAEARHVGHFAGLLKPETAQKVFDGGKKVATWLKGGTAVATAAVGGIVTIAIANSGKDGKFTIPVSIQAATEPGTQKIPVAFTPTIDAGSNTPIPVSFQWKPDATVPKLPVTFTPSGDAAFKFSLDGHPTLDITNASENSQLGSQLFALNTRLGELNKQITGLQDSTTGLDKKLVGIDKAVMDHKVALDGLNARVEGTQAGLHKEIGGVNDHLATWIKTDAGREQTISFSILEASSRTLDLETLNADGTLQTCMVRVSTGKIRKSAILAIDTRACGGTVSHQESVAVGGSLPVVPLQWKLNVDAIDKPFWGTHYVHLRMTSGKTGPVQQASTEATPPIAP